MKISHLKKEGNIIKIFDSSGRYSGKWFSIPRNSEVSGNNSSLIIITFPSLGVSRIYNSYGKDTGDYISIRGDKKIIGVSEERILVKDRRVIRYYDLRGKDTGKYYIP